MKRINDIALIHLFGDIWIMEERRIKGNLKKFKETHSWSMVFCYQNCSDLLWEKIVLVIEKNFWISRLKAENLQKFWNH